MDNVHARYFDGRDARAHAVVLSLHDGVLHVRGGTILRHAPLASLHIAEPLGDAPRAIEFADGARCEVSGPADLAALHTLLATGGRHSGLAAHLQRHWTGALIALLIALLTVAAGYRWGLPAASEWLARQLPPSLLGQLGEHTLANLERTLLKPSRLPPERQRALAEGFARLAAPVGDRPAYRLLFRDGGRMGANALALPGGTLVMTDQLVALARHDNEILAVLAHELGHLERRHAMRMLIQGAIVALVTSWYANDIGTLAASLPALLLEAGYSREHEREADDYAAAMLAANGLTSAPLADMLGRLELAQTGGKSAPGRAREYLASHPSTRERVERLRGHPAAPPPAKKP